MSRGSSQQGANDALELFLDAMSNMFGGVVFIAVIVVILLQFTVMSDRESQADTSESAAEQAAVAALRQEVEALQGLAKPTSLPSPAADSQHAEAADALVAFLSELNTSIEQRRQDLSRLVEQLESERVSQGEFNQKRDQLESRLLEVQTDLDTVVSRTPERLRVPRFNPTAKNEVPFLVSGNRLVSVFEVSAGGRLGAVNRGDLQIDEQAQMASARPGRGMLIEDNDAGRRFVLSAFSGLDPATHYVALAVWPDSFERAVRVRDALIDLGFDYGLTFVPAGSGVPFRAVGGVQ